MSYCLNELSSKNTNIKQKYNLYELEIIKFIKMLLIRNKFSLKYLGFKCVDPTIITQECLDSMVNIEILLLNNVTDTDSVLEEMTVLSNLRAIELCKCVSFDGNGLQDIFEVCTRLETLQIGKSIKLSQCELDEIEWNKLMNLSELYLESIDLYQLSEDLNETNNCFSSFKSLNYLALNNYQFQQSYFPHLSNNNFSLKYFFLRPSISNYDADTLSTNGLFLNNLEMFLNTEYNIEHLDLVGLILLDTDFILSILKQLKNLK